MRKISLSILMLAPLITFAQGQVTRPVKERQQTEVNNEKTNINSKVKETSKNTRKVEYISSPDGFINGHGYVDLGLPSGTKWAVADMGHVEAPDNMPDYYYWGGLQKYMQYGMIVDIDAPKIANLKNNSMFNVVQQIWGENWTIPSKEQWEELVKYCIFKWTKFGNSGGGFRITGPSQESIFIPAISIEVTKGDWKSIGHYWTSDSYSTEDAYCFYIDEDLEHIIQVAEKKRPLMIRPVLVNNK